MRKKVNAKKESASPKKSAQKSLINTEDKDTTIYDNNLNKLLINYAIAWRTGTITVKVKGDTI